MESQYNKDKWREMAQNVSKGRGDPVTGKYTHGLDAKGRLIIPSQMRRELGDVCHVILGPDKCLLVYSDAGWEEFCAKFAGDKISESSLMRFLFANSATCEIDAQGRILVPGELRSFVGIDKEVTIIGLPNRAELWDSEEYKKTEEACFAQKSMRDIYKELGL